MSKKEKKGKKRKKIKGMRGEFAAWERSERAEEEERERREAMRRNQEWWNRFDSLADDDKLAFLDSVLDSESVDPEFWVDGRPFDAFNDTFHELVHKGRLEECIKLMEKFRERKPDWYRKDYPFYDYKLVYYYAARREREKLREALRYFIEEPERDADYLFIVLDALRLYGFAEETYQLSKVAYPRLKDSEGIVPDAIYELRQLVIFCMIWKYIDTTSRGEDEARRKLDEDLRLVFEGLGEDEKLEIEEGLQRTIKILRGEVVNEWKRADFLTARDGCWDNLHTLGMDFVRYMHEKGFEWITADMIREVAVGYFERKREGKYLFRFSKKSFEEYLGMFLGFISIHDIRGMAALKALGYFYTFLREKGILSDDELEMAEEGIREINEELRVRRERDAWKYRFLEEWV